MVVSTKQVYPKALNMGLDRVERIRLEDSAEERPSFSFRPMYSVLKRNQIQLQSKKGRITATTTKYLSVDSEVSCASFLSYEPWEKYNLVYDWPFRNRIAELIGLTNQILR